MIDPPRARHVLHQGGVDTPMPWPSILVVEADKTGAMVFRFAVDGTFGGDTWHESLADAHRQVAWEYQGVVGEWNPLPNDLESVGEFLERELGITEGGRGAVE